MLANHEDPRYVDLSDPKDTRKGGAKTHPLLLEGSMRCYMLQKGQQRPPSPTATIKPPTGAKQIFRCIASKGCNTTWAMPRNKERILDHLSKCSWLDSDLRKRAFSELGKNAIGPPAHISLEDDESHATTADDGGKRLKSGSRVLPLQKSSGSKGGKLPVKAYIGEGRKILKENGEYAIMKYLVCCGVPPTVVDSEEWKELMAILNPAFISPSSSTITSHLIVDEAAKITIAIEQYLGASRNLTITYDGGKIRRPKSFYSIHVTTADRRCFCMALDDGSRLSHSANYIVEALERVSISQSQFGTHILTLLLGYQEHRPMELLRSNIR